MDKKYFLGKYDKINTLVSSWGKSSKWIVLPVSIVK